MVLNFWTGIDGEKNGFKKILLLNVHLYLTTYVDISEKWMMIIKYYILLNTNLLI